MVNCANLLNNYDLDGTDYKKIKSDCERQISIIEGKLIDLAGNTDNIGSILDKALRTVTKLPELYQIADNENKRRIVSSMFPEKLTFDGVEHRTLKINEAIRVFDTVRMVLEQKKDRKKDSKSDLRSEVTPKVQMSNSVISNVKKIVALKMSAE